VVRLEGFVSMNEYGSQNSPFSFRPRHFYEKSGDPFGDFGRAGDERESISENRLSKLKRPVYYDGDRKPSTSHLTVVVGNP
jgi:hypothetical protein